MSMIALTISLILMWARSCQQSDVMCRDQAAGVEGVLLCNGQPYSDAVIQLYDVDTGPDPDDKMDQKTPDLNGMRILHNCEDEQRPCYRKLVVKMPVATELRRDLKSSYNTNMSSVYKSSETKGLLLVESDGESGSSLNEIVLVGFGSSLGSSIEPLDMQSDGFSEIDRRSSDSALIGSLSGDSGHETLISAPIAEEYEGNLVPLQLLLIGENTSADIRSKNIGKSFHDFYNLGDDHLGSGAYACVRTATSIATGIEFAAKLISKHVDGHTRETERVFYGAGGGSCYQDIANALKHLHDRGIAHRDVKPENILCTDLCSVSPVKLLRYGLGYRECRISCARGGQCFIGDPNLKIHGYNSRCDMWSLGVIIYIMLCDMLLSLVSAIVKTVDGIKRIQELNWLSRFNIELSFASTSLGILDEEWKNISDEVKDLIDHLLVSFTIFCEIQHHTFDLGASRRLASDTMRNDVLKHLGSFMLRLFQYSSPDGKNLSRNESRRAQQMNQLFRIFKCPASSLPFALMAVNCARCSKIQTPDSLL
uniref:Protein kinase domain-containing protein n=1 Tax=Ditylenchus dipsaci TaxID=166011 RepID=A0A915DNX1_9BILA